MELCYEEICLISFDKYKVPPCTLSETKARKENLQGLV